MATKEDKETLGKLLGRDETTLLWFYKKHRDKLYNFISRQVADRQDVDEILQDAFIAFLESLRDFRGQSSLKTFLYAIAKNKISDKLRKKKLKNILFSKLPAHLVESLATVLLDDELDRGQLSQKMATVFSQLPHEYAHILRLKYHEGYRVAEISSKLKLSFKATESLLFRARQSFIANYNQT